MEAVVLEGRSRRDVEHTSSVPDADDNLSPSVPGFDIADGFRGRAQRVGPVDHLRRPDCEIVRSQRDRRVQYWKRSSAPIDRSRQRDRLYTR